MSRPIPIAYLITDLDRGGGAEKCLFELATRLPRERFAPRVLCLKGEGPVAARLRAAGIEATCLGLTPSSFLAAPLVLARRVGETGAPILHTFLFHANLLGRVAGHLAGMPAVICSVRVAERDRRWHRTLDRATHAWVSRIVCVSEAVRLFAVEGGIPAWKTRTIPNGIEAPEEPPPLPGGPVPGVASVGRLHPQKGMDVFVEAALAFLRSRREARFRIAGEGPMAEGLKNLARVREASFEFLGHVDGVDAVLDAADLFVLASRWEGMPNAVLEAMARGRPVLATAVDGTTELVEEGVTGRLVPPDDPDALAQAMIEMLSDPARLAAMGRAGHARVRAQFGLQAMVDRHVELYEDLLKGEGAAG